MCLPINLPLLKDVNSNHIPTATLGPAVAEVFVINPKDLDRVLAARAPAAFDDCNANDGTNEPRDHPNLNSDLPYPWLERVSLSQASHFLSTFHDDDGISSFHLSHNAAVSFMSNFANDDGGSAD